MADIGNLNIKIGASADEAIREIEKVNNALKRLKGTKASTKLRVDTKEVDSATKKVSGLAKILESLKRIAFYRAIRTAIKAISQAMREGAENAYFFSQAVGSDLAVALDSIASKSFTMQNQLGAAFATLLQTIQPILIQIISLVTRVIEAITQLFAMLGGKSTFLKATDQAQKYATAAGGAAKATKEWKNQLMGFDEINRLEEPSDSNGGGGGGGIPDYGSMFEEAPLGEWFKQLRDITKEWWNSLDLEPITRAWERLTKAVREFVDLVDQGLYWAYTNVLLPLAGWTIESLAPALVNQLAAAFELLNAVIVKLAPYFLVFFEKVLKPFGKWLGGKIIEHIESWTKALEGLTEKVKDAESFSEFILSLEGKEKILVSLAAGFAAMRITSGVLSLAAEGVKALTKAFTFLKSPAGIAFAAIGLLTYALIELYQNSDKAREQIDSIIKKLKEFDWQSLNITFENVFFNWENITPELLSQKLMTGLFSLMGGIVGFTIGGKPGALIGTLVGATLSVVFDTLAFDGDGKISEGELMEMLKPVLFTLTGGIIGLAGGGLAGAARGAKLGAVAYLALTAVDLAKGEGLGSSVAGLADSVLALLLPLGTAALGFKVANVPGALVGLAIGTVASIVLSQILLDSKESAKAKQNFFNTELGKFVKEIQDEINKVMEVDTELRANITKITGEIDEATVADLEAAKSLIDEIFTVDANENKTAEEIALIKTNIEALDKIGLPGIKLEFDDTTGHVKQTREQVQLLMEDLLKQYELEAMKEAYIDSLKAEYQASQNVEKATDAASKAYDAYQTATANAAEAQEALNAARDKWNSFKTENSGYWTNGEQDSDFVQFQEFKEAEKAANEAQAAMDEAQKALDGTTEALTSSMSTWTEAEEKVSGLKTTLTELATNSQDEGKNIMDGVATGITDNVDSAKDAIKNSATEILEQLKEINDSHSPSRVYADEGKNIMEGLGQGIRENISAATEAMVEGMQMVLGVVTDYINQMKAVWNSDWGRPRFHVPIFMLTGQFDFQTGQTPQVAIADWVWMARGGIVDKATLIGAGEAGKEAIVPLERNTQWIDMIADKLNSSVDSDDGNVAESVEGASDDIVSAILSSTSQIISAMTRNGSSANVDWSAVARQVSKYQTRQARANG